MCWVMPPASPAGDVGLADGVEQRRLAVVDVAHDGDDRRARDAGPPGCPASRRRSRTSSSWNAVDSIWKPNSVAISVAVSRSMSWLMLTPIMPERPELLDDLAPLTPIFLASSATAIVSSMRIDALVLGGRGDLRLLQLLAGGGDPLLGDAAGALAAGAERRDGRTGRGPAGARLIRPARPRRRSSSSRSLISMRGTGCVAARRDAGQLDERARRGRAGDDRLRDRPERRAAADGGCGAAARRRQAGRRSRRSPAFGRRRRDAAARRGRLRRRGDRQRAPARRAAPPASAAAPDARRPPARARPARAAPPRRRRAAARRGSTARRARRGRRSGGWRRGA